MTGYSPHVDEPPARVGPPLASRIDPDAPRISNVLATYNGLSGVMTVSIQGELAQLLRQYLDPSSAVLGCLLDHLEAGTVQRDAVLIYVGQP